jgi:hypothetical protein
MWKHAIEFLVGTENPPKKRKRTKTGSALQTVTEERSDDSEDSIYSDDEDLDIWMRKQAIGLPTEDEQIAAAKAVMASQETPPPNVNLSKSEAQRTNVAESHGSGRAWAGL